MNYDKQYFIDKVTALKEENFKSGVMGNAKCGCILGHCGISGRWIHNKESASLTNLLDPTKNKVEGDEILLSNPAMNFNDDLRKGSFRSGWLQKLNSL